jgi:hypothetical protein
MGVKKVEIGSWSSFESRALRLVADETWRRGRAPTLIALGTDTDQRTLVVEPTDDPGLDVQRLFVGLIGVLDATRAALWVASSAGAFPGASAEAIRNDPSGWHGVIDLHIEYLPHLRTRTVFRAYAFTSTGVRWRGQDEVGTSVQGNLLADLKNTHERAAGHDGPAILEELRSLGFAVHQVPEPRSTGRAAR